MNLLTFILFFELLNFSSFNSFYSKEEALNDLSFIKNTLKENHPGFFFSKDFVINLENCLEIGALEINKSKKSSVRIKILNDLLLKMNCNHLRISMKKENLFEKIIKLFKNFFNFSNKEDKSNNNFSLKQIKNNFFEIKLPNFCPNEIEINKINSLCKEIKNKKSEIKNLIFDIRGNGGGDTRYCDKILEALFGKDYFNFNYAEKNKNLYCLWRASEENFYYLNTLFKKIEKEEGEIFKEFSEKFLEGFKNSLKLKEPFYKFIENNWYIEYKKNNPNFCIKNIEKEFNENLKIYILINKNVASAALDFIDYLYCMDVPIYLVGEKTSYDSIYMDARTLELPSQKGFLTFPQKVYVNRIRKNNESYLPNFSKKSLKKLIKSNSAKE